MTDWKAIHEQLVAPFSLGELQWKPSALSRDRTRALAVAFISARSVEKRLDEAVGPGNWSWELASLTHEDMWVAIGRLTIHGVPMDGVGTDDNDPKAAETDALKRAGVHFGIARYLYSLGQEWVNYDERTRQLSETPRLPRWAVREEEWQENDSATRQDDDSKTLDNLQMELQRLAGLYEPVTPSNDLVERFNSIIVQLDDNDEQRPQVIANIINWAFNVQDVADVKANMLQALIDFFTEHKDGEVVLNEYAHGWYAYLASATK